MVISKTTTIRLPLLAAFTFFLTSLSPMAAQAQVSDPRVPQLEEQMRALTGQVEELNFQILQLQEQIRKQQEDNEFRIQQLEDGKQGSLTPEEPDAGEPQSDVASVIGSQPETGATDESVMTPPKTERLDVVGTQIASSVPAGAVEGSSVVTGAPPRTLGTMTLDPAGNVRDSTIDFSSDGIDRAIDGTEVASVTISGNPEEIYQTGYNHVLQGDYRLAESVFKSFVTIYPDDPLVADARFWLGESVLAQGRYEDAAEIFVDTQSMYPNAPKAPETMLKIGTIMAALGNRDVACVTLADAMTKYPDMPVSTRQSMASVQSKAKC